MGTALALYLCSCAVLAQQVTVCPPMPQIVWLSRPLKRWRHGRAHYNEKAHAIYIHDPTALAHELAHAVRRDHYRELGARMLLGQDISAAVEAGEQEADEVAEICLRRTRL